MVSYTGSVNLSAIEQSALRIAADAHEITIVRKAAIFAIGKMGSKRDVSLLKTLEKESAQLAEAASPAMKRIQGDQAREKKKNEPLITLILD